MRSLRQGEPVQFLPAGIGERLFLLITLAMLPVLLLLGVIYYKHYEAHRQQALQAEQEAAQGVALAFSAYIDGVQRESFALGQAILSISPYRAEKVSQLLTLVAARYPSVRNLSWVGPDGQVLASSLPSMLEHNLSEQPYFQDARVTGRSALSDLTQTGMATHAPTIALATPIFAQDAQLVGMVVVSIEPGRLGELLPSNPRVNDGSFILFDRQGTVVYRGPGSVLAWEQRTGWQAQDAVLQQAIATGQPATGINTITVPLGLTRKWIAARVPIPALGWTVGADSPEAVVLGTLRGEILQDGLLSLLVVAGAFVLAYWLAYSIAAPLRRLGQDTLALSQTPLKLGAHDPLAPREVQHLRQTVENLATELTKRADALATSEDRFRTLFTNMSEAFALGETILDEHGQPVDFRFLEINAAFEKESGLTRAILNVPMTQALPNLERSWIETYSKVALNRHSLRFDNYNQDTNRHYNVFCYSPAYGRFAILFRDITASKQAEEALRQSELRLRQAYQLIETVIESTPDLIAALDTDYRFLVMNQAYRQEFKEIFGQDVQVGDSFLEALAELPDQRARAQALWRRALQGESFRNTQEFGALGLRQGVYEMNFNPVCSPEGELVGAAHFVRDVTERQRMQDALQQAKTEAERNRAQFEAVFHAVSNGIIIADMDGKFILLNEAEARILGYSSPAEVHRELTYFHQLFELTSPDGLRVDPDDWPMTRLLRGERILEQELRARRLDTGREFYFSFTGAPVHNEQGQQVLAVLITRDITDRKRAEEERSAYAKQLELSNRDLQEFAYVASHDLQEPLRKIEAFSDSLMQDTSSLNERQKDFLERMGAAAGRMHGMVNGLLELSRLSTQARSFAPVDLSEVVADVLVDLEVRLQRSQGTVQVQPLPTISADDLQMRQLFLNLIGNALKFQPPGQAPKVEITACQRPGGWVEIQVADNGIGFAPEEVKRLFQPFQRLGKRGQYEGSGLGLSICRRIVERHQGTITARPGPQGGALFTITLPEKPGLTGD